MRFFTRNNGQPFDSGITTHKYLVIIKGGKVGFLFANHTVEWDDVKYGWTLRQVDANVVDKSWLEINEQAARNMGFSF